MILLFMHGWGFDGGLWSVLTQSLPEWRSEIFDRGYFGEAREPALTDPVIAVTHSFGAMRVLHNPPPRCAGLIAINGFDCFTARGDTSGVPSRVTDRMIARFERDPQTVLSDFRRRCGADMPFGRLDEKSLQHDLIALRDMDCTAESVEWKLPILSLQGAQDPILPLAMREAAFCKAPLLERHTHPAAGHLLPLTDVEYCAQHIRTFAERLS